MAQDAGLKPRATVSKPSTATSDSTLTETLRQGRVILGYAMTFDPAASAPGGCVLHPVGLAVQSREESDAAVLSRNRRRLQPAGTVAGSRSIRVS